MVKYTLLLLLVALKHMGKLTRRFFFVLFTFINVIQLLGVYKASPYPVNFSQLK